MSANPLIQAHRLCRGCHQSIGPNASYHGFCLDCLFLPFFDSVDPDEEDASDRFDPYEILTHADGSFIELGRGSMGITYYALDTALQFPVALKVIEFKAAGLEVNRERFLQEARAAARLRHPHVASVLYYDVTESGQCFYAMDLVEGETLAERIQRSGPLSTPDALGVIAQVASALEAAEKHGLVHRDLKPANLMLVDGPDIDVKVIDFGLAKMVGAQEPNDRITHDGFIGTPAFASPEQFRGAQIDQRSDYFSLGSTLFYLLTANPPFNGDQISELAAQMIHRGPLIAQLKAARVPAPVRKLANSLLSAAPEDRPQNGQALVKGIAKCQRAIRKTQRIGRKTGWTVATGVCVLFAALLFLFQSGFFTKDSTAKSIAVLPFDNLSPAKDDSYFADGVQDDILTNLAKIADLRVISRASVQVYRNPANRPPSREIGEALNVRYLLKGSIRREGGRIRVTAQLEEARTGRELWAERYDGELTDVFTIQVELAEEISQELRAKLSKAEKSSLAQIPTHNLAAYELYLHAKELMANYDAQTQSTEPLYSAVRLLEEGVNRDPGFALAWAMLARAHDALYSNNADHTDSRRAAAENALQQALRLRPDLGEVHLEAGHFLLVTTRDYPAIRRELEIARRTLPNSANVFGLLASIASRQGQWHEAVQDYQKASALDPKNVHWLIALYGMYDFHRQYEEVYRGLVEIARVGANTQAIAFKKAVMAWQERDDTSALHALFDGPAGPLRAIGQATLQKICYELADRDFAKAEQILAADPRQEFEVSERRLVCRDFLLGWIKKAEGDGAAVKVAFANSRPSQVAYVQKWPNEPNPLMMLALTDAALGRKEDALSEGRQAMMMRPVSQDAVDGPVLALDLAGVYLWAGERELALKQLETLEQVPRALTYGDLTMPDWDPLQNDPRFQELLAKLKQPIPIVDRTDLAKK
jgi:serine/threonine protein kinase/Tfp pilus assembly protein PilF